MPSVAPTNPPGADTFEPFDAEALERLLDEALEETFPASDPIAPALPPRSARPAGLSPPPARRRPRRRSQRS